jgi:hypothetical protein
MIKINTQICVYAHCMYNTELDIGEMKYLQFGCPTY